MDRRRFGAILVGGAAALPSAVFAQDNTIDECRSTTAFKSVTQMMTTAMDVPEEEMASPEDAGYVLLKMIIVASAGRAVIDGVTPTAELKKSYRLLADAFDTIAKAEDDVRMGLFDSDVDALIRGLETASPGLTQFGEAVDSAPADAMPTLSERQRALSESTKSPSVTPTTAPAPTTPPAPTAPPVNRTQSSNSPGVSLANFNRLQTGMTYQEVVSILGSRGELISSSELAGTKTEMYQWEGTSLGANMNAMFQDGKLISKAQFGLK